jgi:hypothetical protein
VSSTAEAPIRVTVFDGEKDNRGQVRVGTVGGLFPPHVAREQKAGTIAWAPVEMIDPARGRDKDNVHTLTALVFDLDHLAPEDVPAVRAAITAACVAAVMSTTFSHTPTAQRYRMLVTLSRPVTRAEHTRLWAIVNERLCLGHADPAARDAFRIYYMTACPAVRLADAHTTFFDGAPLDVDAELRVVDADLEAAARRVEAAPQGERNRTLNTEAFKVGARIGAGATDRQAAEGRLLAAAQRAGLGDDEARATIASGLLAGAAEAANDAEIARVINKAAETAAAAAPDEDQAGTKVKTLIGVARRRYKLLRDADRVTYGADGAHAIRIKSAAFSQSLTVIAVELFGTAPSATLMDTAIRTLDAIASTVPCERVFMRVGEKDGTIYVDLGDDSGRVVKVTAAGWSLVPSPVYFRRPRSMRPLPMPERGGSLDELRALLNLGGDAAGERAWTLIVAWLVAALRPQGPYPVAQFQGEQGSAKSTMCRMVRALVDPSTIPVRAEPRDMRDLAVAAENAWVLVFDNLSHLSTWLSDGLCRLATGGGYATRALYTDSDEQTMDAQRPCVLNGIGAVATAGDLLERSLLIGLPVIPETARRTEADLWKAFNAAHGRIFGALLDAVSCALRRVDAVKLPRLPRMADFAVWATAAEPALGLVDGAVMAALDENTNDAAATALDDSPIALAIQRYAELPAFMQNPTPKTPSALLADLEQLVSIEVRRQAGWPRSPARLGRELRRLAPGLRKHGIEVDTKKSNGSRAIVISKVEAIADDLAPAPSVASPKSASTWAKAAREALALTDETTAARVRRLGIGGDL